MRHWRETSFIIILATACAVLIVFIVNLAIIQPLTSSPGPAIAAPMVTETAIEQMEYTDAERYRLFAAYSHESMWATMEMTGEIENFKRALNGDMPREWNIGRTQAINQGWQALREIEPMTAEAQEVHRLFVAAYEYCAMSASVARSGVQEYDFVRRLLNECDRQLELAETEGLRIIDSLNK